MNENNETLNVGKKDHPFNKHSTKARNTRSSIYVY